MFGKTESSDSPSNAKCIVYFQTTGNRWKFLFVAQLKYCNVQIWWSIFCKNNKQILFYDCSNIYIYDQNIYIASLYLIEMYNSPWLTCSRGWETGRSSQLCISYALEWSEMVSIINWNETRWFPLHSKYSIVTVLSQASSKCNFQGMQTSNYFYILRLTRYFLAFF